MQRKRIVAITACLFLVVFVTSVRATLVFADDDGGDCYSAETTLSASTELPAGSYKMYGRASAGLPVSVYVESTGTTDSVCEWLASTELTTTWKYLGTRDSLAEQETSVIAALSNDTSAEKVLVTKPEIVFIPTQANVTVQSSTLLAHVGKERAALSPLTVQTEESDFVIRRVVDPLHDAVRSVDYYLGTQFMYTRPGVDDTAELAALYPAETNLLRLVNYASGQQAQISSVLPRSPDMSAWTLVKQSTKMLTPLWGWVCVLLGVLVVVYGARLVLVFRRKHRLWRQNHGLQLPQPSRFEQWHMRRFGVEQWQQVQAVSEVGGKVVRRVIIVVVCVFCVGSFFLDVFVVQGVSMERTYHSGQKVLVAKNHQTWGRYVTGKMPVPTRGSVVIARDTQASAARLPFVEMQQRGVLIKRVIGLPGETLDISSGVVHVTKPDGTELLPDEESAWAKNLQLDTLGGSITVHLGADEVFLLGDNRPRSIDSRLLGPVRLRDIIGVVRQ